MIYEDKPLQGEGVGTSRWPEAWDPRRMHRSAPPRESSLESPPSRRGARVFDSPPPPLRGPGVLLEGLFRKKVKHVLHDSTGAKVHRQREGGEGGREWLWGERPFPAEVCVCWRMSTPSTAGGNQILLSLSLPPSPSLPPSLPLSLTLPHPPSLPSPSLTLTPSLTLPPSLPPSLSPAQHRFIVFHVEFTQACQRKFDSQGQEVEPNFGKTGVVRTGYLHSSYSECRPRPRLPLFWLIPRLC